MQISRETTDPIVVIGAGVVGVMTAYSLVKRGYPVALVDVLDGPAEHCSHGNAGIMAVGHADAWASPAAIGLIFRALAGVEPSIRVTKLVDSALWYWGAEFLRNCTRAAHHRNTDCMQRLSHYSRNLLAPTEVELGLPADTRHDGGLYLFQNQEQFNKRATDLIKSGDSALELLTRDQLLELEPSLHHMGAGLIGGIFSHVDSVGDCRLFTNRVVEVLRRNNRLETYFGRRVTGFEVDSARIVAVETEAGRMNCAGAILAMGTETSEVTRKLGFTPRIYPVKGYSGTWRVLDPASVPRLPFVDETELLAVATYGGVLRVTAIAEFAGMDRSLPLDRTRRLADYVRRSFGTAVDFDSASFWTGLRPTTPSGPPYLGRVHGYNNLWINAGHGQLGWTMSFGCGELIAQSISGKPLPINDVSAQASWLVPF